MATIPLWLRGRDITALSLTPQTVNAATGVLTDGAASSLLSHWEDVTLETTKELEEISPADAVRAHHEVLKTSTRITFREIMKRVGASSDKLAALAVANDIFKAIVTRSGKTWTFYGIIASYSENIVKGKSIATLVLEMVDPGESNPAAS